MLFPATIGPEVGFGPQIWAQLHCPQIYRRKRYSCKRWFSRVSLVGVRHGCRFCSDHTHRSIILLMSCRFLISFSRIGSKKRTWQVLTSLENLQAIVADSRSSFCYADPRRLHSTPETTTELRGKSTRYPDEPLDSRALSDKEILVSKIKAGSSEEAILRTLMQDEACNTIILNHELVGNLLSKFKDDWKSALAIFRWAETRPGFKHSSESYDMMVDILGKTRQFDEMKQLVEEMNQRNSVTLMTIAKMMRRYAGADMWTDVVQVFDDLDKYGLKKNTESMNLLLDALCKEKQVDRAREVFLELKSHIAPNANTYNIFIHGWCKVNHVDEAYWTIQEMKGNGFHPCVISYSTIIQSYCQQSNYGKVYELLDEMDTQKCPANVVTYTSIMSSLTKSEEYNEALTITERMKAVGCKPDTQFYNALIHTFGRAGRVREAVRVFEEEMPENSISPNTSTYNTMIAMFCRLHREERAFRLLEDMKKKGKCKPDVQSFYPLLKSCFRTGTVHSCLSELLDEMTNKYHLSLDVSAYTLLIHGLCKVKEPEWAYRIFEKMIIQGLKPRDLTCQLLLDELKLGRMDDAVDRVEVYMKQMKAFQS